MKNRVNRCSPDNVSLGAWSSVCQGPLFFKRFLALLYYCPLWPGWGRATMRDLQATMRPPLLWATQTKGPQMLLTHLSLQTLPHLCSPPLDANSCTSFSPCGAQPELSAWVGVVPGRAVGQQLHSPTGSAGPEAPQGMVGPTQPCCGMFLVSQSHGWCHKLPPCQPLQMCWPWQQNTSRWPTGILWLSGIRSNLDRAFLPSFLEEDRSNPSPPEILRLCGSSSKPEPMEVDPSESDIKPVEVDLPPEEEPVEVNTPPLGQASAITSCLPGDITTSVGSTPGAINFQLSVEMSPFTRDPQHQLLLPTYLLPHLSPILVLPARPLTSSFLSSEEKGRTWTGTNVLWAAALEQQEEPSR